jgi:hypothetical protein
MMICFAHTVARVATPVQGLKCYEAMLVTFISARAKRHSCEETHKRRSTFATS